MTVYNRPHITLVNTLSNIGKNDLRDTEILLIDDGSSAPYEDLLGAYKNSPVRYERVDTLTDRPGTYNIDGFNNPAYAMNCGIELAQGEELFFMSSDVMIPPATMSAAADMNLERVAWMPCVVDMDTNTTYLGPDRVAPLGWFFGTHRKNVEAVKWDENYLKGIACEDNDFMARLALHVGRFVCETALIAWHQSHPPLAYSDGEKGLEINKAYTYEKWGCMPWYPSTGNCMKIEHTNVNSQMVLDCTPIEEKKLIVS